MKSPASIWRRHRLVSELLFSSFMKTLLSFLLLSSFAHADCTLNGTLRALCTASNGDKLLLSDFDCHQSKYQKSSEAVYSGELKAERDEKLKQTTYTFSKDIVVMPDSAYKKIDELSRNYLLRAIDIVEAGNNDEEFKTLSASFATQKIASGQVFEFNKKNKKVAVGTIDCRIPTGN